MAHKALGVDLGSYSVKVVELDVGFRTVQVTGLYSRLVAPGDDPLVERQARTLGELLAERGLTADLRFEALHGDNLMIRVLTLPFGDAKKIDQVVGYELEGQIARDIDDVVFDHQVLADALAPARAPDLAPPPEAAAGAKPEPAKPEPAPPSPGGPSGSAGRGGVAPVNDARGTRVLVAAAVKAQLRDHLGRMLAATGSEPRAVLGAPLVFGQALARAEAGPDPVAVLDLGHERTTLSVLSGGATLFTRTLPRGGKQLSVAVARRFNVSPDQADQVKQGSAFVATRRTLGTLDADQTAMHEVVAGELWALVRDLRQTLAAFRATFGVAVARVVTVGGTSRLNGIQDFLAEQLELPVAPLDLVDSPELAALTPTLDRGLATPELALPLAIALEGVSGRAAFDFRQDEFSYRADYSFLRGKAVTLATAGLLIIALAAVMAWSELYKLKKEERILSDRFTSLSVEVLGSTMDPADVKAALRESKQTVSPIPTMTAYDLFQELNKSLPERDKIKLDITEMEIRSKKISMKATVANQQQKEDLEKALKTIPCIASGDIQSSKVTSGMNADEKQFTLTIAHKCF